MQDLTYRLREREDFSREVFEKGDALLQPAYAWVWNAPAEEGEILRQLDGMVRAGIRCLYVIPEPENFRDYTRRVHLEPEYLSPAFFERLRFMAREALARGMVLWLYDEGGWPSGSACGQVRAKNPGLCRKSLALRKVTLARGEAYAPGDRALAAFLDGRRVLPGETLPEDGELDEYCVEWLPGLTVDPLDEELGQAFIESTHEKYARYFRDLLGERDENGNDIPGSGKCQLIFTDEPAAGRYPWPRDFENTFRDRFGYDLLPYLPWIADMDRDADEAAVRARMDYRQLTGELFLKNYFAPIRRWCRAHNTLSGGHLDIDHLTNGCLYHSYGSTLPLLREMDVPGVDVIWRQITLPRDGQRPCGEGNGFFPRFASSAAAQSGGKYALSESLAVYGAQLEGDEIAYVVHFQLVRGINLFNFMSMSFGRDGAVPTIARPNFSAEMPGYEHLAALNDYVMRACWLMQLGEPGEDTALYFPARDLWAGGASRDAAVAAFDGLGRALEEKQVDFDIIDDEGIRQAVVRDGALCLGRAKYRHVIVPECRYMPEDVRDKLKAVDGSAAPALDCGCPDIRVRRRILPGGKTMWMLFNESDREAAIRPGFGPRAACRLDPEEARMERWDGQSELRLRSGEAAFFLCGGDFPEAKPAQLERPGQIIEHFTLRRTRSSTVDGRGLRDERIEEAPFPCRLGSWEPYFGKTFSGEAVYSAEVALEKAPGAEEEVILDLGKVCASARVYVNGRCAGVAWHSPKKVRFPESWLEGKTAFRLDIEVANTLANQFAATDLFSLFPRDELGFYQERLSAFEKDPPAGGLYGPVIIRL